MSSGLAAQPDAKDRGHSAASSSWWACSDTPGGRGRWWKTMDVPHYRAPGRGSRLSRNLQVELVPAVGVRVESTWVDPPRRWREGQGHDRWHREMVQRRQGLRL